MYIKCDKCNIWHKNILNSFNFCPYCGTNLNKKMKNIISSFILNVKIVITKREPKSRLSYTIP
jgi:hypothetical protein